MPRNPSPVERSIAASALELIREPDRHTTIASAINDDGKNCAGATDDAVAWSVFGAVNRVTVLHFNTLAYMDEWRSTIKRLIGAGARHSTPHAESVRLLEAASHA